MINEKKHVENLVKGSYRDFSLLHEHYWPRIFSFIYSIVHSKFIAEEISQETFIKIWSIREAIDVDLSFKSFIFTIAKNKLLNEFRKQINSPLFSDFIEHLETINYSDNDTENQIDFNEFRSKLENAKQHLTSRQREIFQLNKEYGLSVSEIALRLTITEQSVRNQLSKAVIQLKTQLKDYDLMILVLFVFRGTLK